MEQLVSCFWHLLLAVASSLLFRWLLAAGGVV